MEMSFVKNWWLTDYAKDISNTLRQKEKQRITFHFRSPQLHYRAHLVKWICSIAEEMNLSNTTVHVAIYMLDVFMDNHAIALESLNLITLVCLLLAAKFEERDINVPKISDMNALIENAYPTGDFLCMEFMTLQFFKWSLVFPTAVHFAEYYVIYVTSPCDMKAVNSFESYKDLQHSAQQYVKDFLDYSLQDVKFHMFKPSLVAASCIALARMSLHIPQRWTPVLRSLTQYNIRDLQPCMDILLSFLRNQTANPVTIDRKRKLLESPDHGYVTSGSVTSSPEMSKKR